MVISQKVLVVDDSLTVREEVRQVLDRVGFTAVEAEDGVDALDRIAAHPDIALAIVDVNMPRMNGLDLLDRCRQDSRALPVVMLTTEAQPALVARAKALGAKGWTIKPFKPDLLAAAVKKLVQAATAA